MKHCKLLSLLSAAVLGCSATVIPLAAELPANVIVAEAATEYTYGSFKYTVSGSNATITKYTGSSSSVSIPATIPHQGSTLNVKKIGARAFRGKSLSKVGIPDEVTAIGEDAFQGCYNLNELTLPSKLKTIGKHAFANTVITELEIPSKVTAIKEGAFYQCYHLTYVNIKGAAAIYDDAFRSCQSLKNVKLNNNCSRGDNGDADTANAQNVFTDCLSLTKINGRTILGSYTQNGITYPKLVNSHAEDIDAVRKFFIRSHNVKFIDQYVGQLINAIIARDISSWMSMNYRTRQLHDWLLRNCDKYQSGTDVFGEATNADFPEYNTMEGVFMSYALDGKGRASGLGFAAAFQRILYRNGIETYIAYTRTRSPLYMNVIKIKNKYYLSCPFKDNEVFDASTNQTNHSTDYTYFLKKLSEMSAAFGDVSISLANNLSYFDERKYVYGTYNEDAVTDCIYTFNDPNHNGILNGTVSGHAEEDWNSDDKVNSLDTPIHDAFSNYWSIGSISIFFYYLQYEWHQTPQQFAQTHPA